MELFYNPFLRMNEYSLDRLILAGKPYLVIQRFEWPGVQKGFLVSAYEQLQEAELHAQELAPKEGKAQNLLEESERDKVFEVVKTGSGFQVFFNGTIDAKNAKRLEKAYAKPVHGYIKYIRLPNEDGYQIRIFVEYGRVRAEISSGGHSHTELFIKMIR